MRPRNQTARDRLTPVLARQAAVSASDLAGAIGVSIPTLHRMLAESEGNVVSTGKARRTRYALRRALRGHNAELPLYEIDREGRASPLSKLSLVRPEGSCMLLAGTGWPVPDGARDGWWPGLPYPLYDMRPQGYMGRHLARAEHRALAVSANPQEWGDDDIAHVLSRSGTDLSGNLILGDPAFESWQAANVNAVEPLKPRAVASAYARLADEAVHAGVAGSSAAGEFPKFPALRERAGSATPHVLVKFSGADRSATVRRWSDLLVAEHLALECVTGLPHVTGARSRIIEQAGRTLLEVERFDRQGRFGRSRLVSLAALDAALIGSGSSDWNLHASRLAAQGLLAADAVSGIAHLWWFGRLIANTDMHTGNLSFRPDKVLLLSPAYDMLPMHYAPLAGGELPTRTFEPPLPLPSHRATWHSACAAAIAFWTSAAADSRISAGFRRICTANGTQLQRVAERV